MCNFANHLRHHPTPSAVMKPKPALPQGNGQSQANPGLVAIEKVLTARIYGLEAELGVLKKSLLDIMQSKTVPQNKVEVPVPLPVPPPSAFTGVGKKPKTTVVVPEAPPVMEQIMDIYPELDPNILEDILTLIERSGQYE